MTLNCPVNLGEPIDNTQVYILDEHLNLTAPGAIGHWYVTGAGVTLGYLNQPQLNDQVFIVDPFYREGDANSSARLYRTGDLVCKDANGTLLYFGRIDHQVKIRGFRIELGEIGSVLVAIDTVNDAVVVASQSDSADKYLVAYVTMDNGHSVGCRGSGQ